VTWLLAGLRRRATFVWLATAVLVAIGVACAFGMPSGIYPEVEFPRIVVVARTGGAPPDVFMTSVTRPLEQGLATVVGVQRIRSKTIRGATEISLLFAPDTDMWRAFTLVQARVSETRGTLPADTDIVVDRVTTGSFPVVTFNVSGHVDPRVLRETADWVVRPALANVPGAARVEVLGGEVREVEVVLDDDRAAALHLTAADVADRIHTALGLRAVGRVDRSGQVVTVMADALPTALRGIEDIPVAVSPRGIAIPLSSVAEVIEGHEDRLARVGGPRGETVAISVARLPGASTPDVVDRAIAEARALGPSLPAGVSLEPVYDQAALVRESMASVRDAIVIGIALCALTIALFLRDVRAGLIAGMTVPITLAISFIAMRLASQTLNLMSLGGMAVAIGLVVDDAIVMIEAIARKRQEGLDPLAAATEGAKSLASPIIGTTVTTVVVFAPLALLKGVVGAFFGALAFTLTTAVIVSLAIALFLVPLAASYLPPPKTPAPEGKTTRYDALVRRLIAHPRVSLVAYALVIAIGALVAPHVSTGFLPTMDEGTFVLDYFLPAGTSLAATESYAREIEHELVTTPDVETFTRRTGAELGPAAATELNRGDIMVRLVSGHRRPIDDVIADVRARVEQHVPEARVEFVQVLQDMLGDLAGSPRPVELKLFGPDYDELHRIAKKMSVDLRKVDGLVDYYDGDAGAAPELRFVADRAEVARLGTTPDAVASDISTTLLGDVAGAIRRNDRLLGVRVRYGDLVRFDPKRVLDLPFATRGVVTKLGAVARPTWDATPAERLHESLQPMVDLTGDVEGRDLGSVAKDALAATARTPLPRGYRLALGGQAASQRATLRDLIEVGAAAILLVITVLAAQFRRFGLPFVVVASVPVAIVGALAALLVTGTALNASSLMGCVLLIGLVVKNGILLLEEAERQRDAGAPSEDAIAMASQRRVRPVLMTTLATVAGLFPLALGIGAGAELQRPLAIAVIGGLVTATAATLALLPSIAIRAMRRA
jgi:CzcA family heavy metal efflux pump